MRVVIKGVHKVRRRLADGSVRTYYYAWRGGPRIDAEPHTETFLIEYANHKRLATASVRPTNTLETLIEYFTGTDAKPNPDFDKLAETTKRDYLYAFRLIRAEWPLLPIKLTQARGMTREIREWHRRQSANPRKADKLLFALSKVFSYAVQHEFIDKNPCSGVERLYKASRRDAVWSPAQIAVFRQRAPVPVLRVFEAALHTGQRQGDLLALRWSDYDGTYLRFRQRKGGVRVKVLVHATLKAILDSLPKTALTIFTNSRGRPWTSDGFKTSFGKAQDRAGVEGVTFHDLRGTFITERRREGSTAEQIASISGHTIAEVNSVLERHYLAADQETGDAVILRMKR